MKKLLVTVLLCTQATAQANLFKAVQSMGRGITKSASFAESLGKTAKATGRFCLFSAKYGTPVIGFLGLKNLGQVAQQKNFTLQTQDGRQSALKQTTDGMKQDGWKILAGLKHLLFESQRYCGINFPSLINK